MTNQTITIKGEQFPFILNTVSLKKFSKIQGINKPSQIGKFLTGIDFSDPSWDTLDILTCLLEVGIKEGERQGGKPVNFTADDLLALLSESPEMIGELFANFTESVTVETEGKPTPATATTKG